LEECPYCNTSRLNPAGAPWSVFSYVPLKPQLLALYCNKSMCEKLKYRANYKDDNEHIEDIFDGDRYTELQNSFVKIDEKEQPHQFFEDDHEIALGLSLDGMCPFKRRKASCWPLILINYNLPPDIRTHLHNILCVGVIPGPHSPKDINSFLQPLIDELLELAIGIKAVNVLQEELFIMRAHLLTIFGDIPAITKVLELIGHNGQFPCCFCMIQAIPGRTSGNGIHLYCPLHRTNGDSLDPLELPIHTHEETIQLGYEVLCALTENAASTHATECGIKGISLLVRLPSVSIPASFPVEVMHMVWINLMPQLVDLWTENFHDIDDGTEDYCINQLLWNSFSNACEESGITIPSEFGCRVPNLSKRSHFIAESWSLWATQLAPNLLRRRFPKPKYYLHFVRLINLIKECTDYSLPRSELPHIREGFAQWVQDYEK
jgi:hypothetical protein